MKVFEASDRDGGRKTIIVTESMGDALRLFMAHYNFIPPEGIFEITGDGQVVLFEKEDE